MYGNALAVSAVVVSFIGLLFKSFPGGRLLPGVLLYFAVLVGASATFAVLNAQDEQEARANEGAEVAKADAEAAAEAGAPEGATQTLPPSTSGGAAQGGAAPAQPAAKGPGG